MKGSIQMVFQKAGLEIYNYDSTHCIYYELIETIPQVSNLIYSRSFQCLVILLVTDIVIGISWRGGCYDVFLFYYIKP
jgi:hypothetical protein